MTTTLLISHRRGQLPSVRAAVDFLAEGMARCRSAWPGRDIRISAQSYLLDFYTGLGFAVVGEEYLEDGIPHHEMLRPGR